MTSCRASPEDEPLKLYIVIDAAVTGHDLAFANMINPGYGNKDPQFLVDAPFELFLKDIEFTLSSFSPIRLGGTLTLSSSVIL